MSEDKTKESCCEDTKQKDCCKDGVAKVGSTVKVNYVGKLEDGTIFDEAKLHKGPLKFKVGDNKFLPEFENGVIGLKAGEKKTITIKSENAYGQRQEKLLQKIGKDRLPKDVEPKVGQSLIARNEKNEEIVVIVTEVGEKDITIDMNHPLAGKELIFEIELLEIVK